MEQAEIRAYALAFVSFLVREMKSGVRLIDKVVLYGSVAMGAATKESDVDIFIETRKSIKPEVENILARFYKSKEAMLFRLKRIENEISIKVGDLKKWKELHRSISSTGIVLWGDYEATGPPIGTKREIIVYWSGMHKNRTAFLNRIYGFGSGGKKRTGLIEVWDGKRLGKSCVMVPAKYRNEVMDLAKKYGVNLKAIEAFVLV